MKKKLIILSLVLSIKIFALGGVNVLTTPTASGLGNPVQQAEISPDSVFYNPAALGFLQDGQYIAGGSSFVQPDYRSEKRNIRTGDDTVVSVDNLIIIPNVQYIYKEKERAYYIGMGSMGQGGLLDPSVRSNIVKSVDVDYLAPGVVFGVAQNINEKTSISLGGRYTYVYQNIEVQGKGPHKKSIDGEAEITGGGIAPEIGVFYRATEKLDLSAKYLFKTKIEQDADVSGSRPSVENFIDEKIPKRGDYPAVLSTGAAYALDEKNKFFAGYNLIFEDSNYVYGGGYDDNASYGNTQEYMVGYTRKLNEKIKLELGYTYVDKGGNDKDPVVMQELDAQVYGIAMRYKYDENTEYLLALNFNIYDDEGSGYGAIKSDAYRRETNIGVGISKKFEV